MEKIEVWLLLARERYPLKSDSELRALSRIAASHWFDDSDSELAELFDQYVMMVKLYNCSGALDVRDR